MELIKCNSQFVGPQVLFTYIKKVYRDSYIRLLLRQNYLNLFVCALDLGRCNKCEDCSMFYDAVKMSDVKLLETIEQLNLATVESVPSLANYFITTNDKGTQEIITNIKKFLCDVLQKYYDRPSISRETLKDDMIIQKILDLYTKNMKAPGPPARGKKMPRNFMRFDKPGETKKLVITDEEYLEAQTRLKHKIITSYIEEFKTELLERDKDTYILRFDQLNSTKVDQFTYELLLHTITIYRNMALLLNTQPDILITYLNKMIPDRDVTISDLDTKYTFIKGIFERISTGLALVEDQMYIAAYITNIILQKYGFNMDYAIEIRRDALISQFVDLFTEAKEISGNLDFSFQIYKSVHFNISEKEMQELVEESGGDNATLEELVTNKYNEKYFNILGKAGKINEEDLSEIQMAGTEEDLMQELDRRNALGKYYYMNPDNLPKNLEETAPNTVKIHLNLRTKYKPSAQTQIAKEIKKAYGKKSYKNLRKKFEKLTQPLDTETENLIYEVYKDYPSDYETTYRQFHHFFTNPGVSEDHKFKTQVLLNGGRVEEEIEGVSRDQLQPLLYSGSSEGDGLVKLDLGDLNELDKETYILRALRYMFYVVNSRDVRVEAVVAKSTKRPVHITKNPELITNVDIEYIANRYFTDILYRSGLVYQEDYEEAFNFFKSKLTEYVKNRLLFYDLPNFVSRIKHHAFEKKLSQINNARKLNDLQNIFEEYVHYLYEINPSLKAGWVYNAWEIVSPHLFQPKTSKSIEKVKDDFFRSTNYPSPEELNNVVDEINNTSRHSNPKIHYNHSSTVPFYVSFNPPHQLKVNIRFGYLGIIELYFEKVLSKSKGTAAQHEKKIREEISQYAIDYFNSPSKDQLELTIDDGTQIILKKSVDVFTVIRQDINNTTVTYTLPDKHAQIAQIKSEYEHFYNTLESRLTKYQTAATNVFTIKDRYEQDLHNQDILNKINYELTILRKGQIYMTSYTTVGSKHQTIEDVHMYIPNPYVPHVKRAEYRNWVGKKEMHTQWGGYLGYHELMPLNYFVEMSEYDKTLYFRDTLKFFNEDAIDLKKHIKEISDRLKIVKINHRDNKNQIYKNYRKQLGALNDELSNDLIDERRLDIINKQLQNANKMNDNLLVLEMASVKKEYKYNETMEELQNSRKSSRLQIENMFNAAQKEDRFYDIYADDNKICRGTPEKFANLLGTTNSVKNINNVIVQKHALLFGENLSVAGKDFATVCRDYYARLLQEKSAKELALGYSRFDRVYEYILKSLNDTLSDATDNDLYSIPNIYYANSKDYDEIVETLVENRASYLKEGGEYSRLAIQEVRENLVNYESKFLLKTLEMLYNDTLLEVLGKIKNKVHQQATQQTDYDRLLTALEYFKTHPYSNARTSAQTVLESFVLEGEAQSEVWNSAELNKAFKTLYYTLYQDMSICYIYNVRGIADPSYQRIFQEINKFLVNHRSEKLLKKIKLTKGSKSYIPEYLDSFKKLIEYAKSQTRPIDFLDMTYDMPGTTDKHNTDYQTYKYFTYEYIRRKNYRYFPNRVKMHPNDFKDGLFKYYLADKKSTNLKALKTQFDITSKIVGPASNTFTKYVNFEKTKGAEAPKPAGSQYGYYLTELSKMYAVLYLIFMTKKTSTDTYLTTSQFNKLHPHEMIEYLNLHDVLHLKWYSSIGEKQYSDIIGYMNKIRESQTKTAMSKLYRLFRKIMIDQFYVYDFTDDNYVSESKDRRHPVGVANTLTSDQLNYLRNLDLTPNVLAYIRNISYDVYNRVSQLKINENSLNKYFEDHDVPNTLKLRSDKTNYVIIKSVLDDKPTENTVDINNLDMVWKIKVRQPVDEELLE